MLFVKNLSLSWTHTALGIDVQHRLVVAPLAAPASVMRVSRPLTLCPPPGRCTVKRRVLVIKVLGASSARCFGSLWEGEEHGRWQFSNLFGPSPSLPTEHLRACLYYCAQVFGKGFFRPKHVHR